jgi:hypothetical protein
MRKVCTANSCVRVAIRYTESASTLFTSFEIEREGAAWWYRHRNGLELLFSIENRAMLNDVVSRVEVLSSSVRIVAQSILECRKAMILTTSGDKN